MRLTNSIALACKAAIGSSLGYGLAALVGNPDALSAAFVAVVCISPTVLAGLRLGVEQAGGSLVGGAIATGIALIGLPPWLGLGLAVGLSIGAVFALGAGRAFPVAAFTSVYIFLVPFGGPAMTLAVRAQAVLLGATAAMLVNAIVSSMAYQRIFDDRIRRVEALLAHHLERLVNEKAHTIQPVFAVLAALDAELVMAKRELRLRRAAGHRRVAERLSEVRLLTRVTHFAADLALVVDEAGESLTASDKGLFQHVAARLRGATSDPPAALGEVGDRLLAANERYIDLRDQRFTSKDQANG